MSTAQTTAPASPLTTTSTPRYMADSTGTADTIGTADTADTAGTDRTGDTAQKIYKCRPYDWCRGQRDRRTYRVYHKRRSIPRLLQVKFYYIPSLLSLSRLEVGIYKRKQESKKKKKENTPSPKKTTKKKRK